MKVFDFLCQELSVTTNRPIVGKERYDLWTSMALQNAHPAFGLTPEAAAAYLEAGEGNLIGRCREKVGPKVWARLVDTVRNFNHDVERPEEIFARICGLDDD